MEEVSIQNLNQTKNATGTIFYLKNKFGWADRQEIKSVNVNTALEMESLSDEQLDQLLQQFE